MPTLELPSSYTSQTKNEALGAVVAKLRTLMEQIKESVRSSEYEEAIAAIAEAFYVAGFGCGLTIVSTSELSDSLTDQLREMVGGSESLIDAHEFIRSKILKKERGERGVEVPNMGKTGGAELAGWENPSARDNLVTMLLTQVAENDFRLPLINGKDLDPSDMADLASMVFNNEYMLGIVDSLNYTRPADLEQISAGPLGGRSAKIIAKRGKESTAYTALEYIPIAKERLSALKFDKAIASRIEKKRKKKEGVVVRKTAQPVIEQAPVYEKAPVYEDEYDVFGVGTPSVAPIQGYIARYFQSILGR